MNHNQGHLQKIQRETVRACTTFNSVLFRGLFQKWMLTIKVLLNILIGEFNETYIEALHLLIIKIAHSPVEASCLPLFSESLALCHCWAGHQFSTVGSTRNKVKSAILSDCCENTFWFPPPTFLSSPSHAQHMGFHIIIESLPLNWCCDASKYAHCLTAEAMGTDLYPPAWQPFWMNSLETVIKNVLLLLLRIVNT